MPHSLLVHHSFSLVKGGKFGRDNNNPEETKNLPKILVKHALINNSPFFIALCCKNSVFIIIV